MNAAERFTSTDGVCSADVAQGCLPVPGLTKQTRRRFRLIVAISLALFLAACGGGGGQGEMKESASTAIAKKVPVAAPNPTLVGGPISGVTMTTAGFQLLRSIGALADGGYAVAWTSVMSDSETDRPLHIQQYDAAGDKVGGVITAPLALPGEQRFDKMAVLRDGRVVVAYSREARAFMRIFDPRAGTRGESLVQDLFSGSNRVQSNGLEVLALADGGFVIGVTSTWGGPRGPEQSLYNVRFGQGQRLSDTYVLGSGGQISSRYAADLEGGYTVTTFPSFGSVVFNHYDANQARKVFLEMGSFGGFVLPLQTGGYALFTRNAPGPFFRPELDPSTNFMQLLDSEGHPIGAPTPISSFPFEVKKLADGSFVAFWNTVGNITAQRYDDIGAPIGNVLTLATSGEVPLVAPLDDGGFALAWSARSGVSTQVFQEELQGNDKVALRLKRKACLDSAKGVQSLRGRERKAFVDACLR